MKKIILTSLILVLSLSTTFADCKTNISQNEYNIGNLEQTILNIGEKIVNKSDKTKLTKLVGVLEKIKGKNDKQRGIIKLLKDYFSCEIKLTGLDITGTIGTEPDLNNYNFTNGNDIINESEIKRYFDDFEKYRNGKNIFDIKGLNTLESARRSSSEGYVGFYENYVTWYKQNVFEDTKYWHRNTSHTNLVPSSILSATDKNKQIINLKISAKIIDELMPAGYIDYPDSNQIFDDNRFKINEWKNKIQSIYKKYRSKRSKINSGELNLNGLILIADTLGSYKYWDGKYIDFIIYRPKYSNNPEEHYYGDAASKVHSIAPTHFDMCPGLFYYGDYHKRWEKYSTDDIKYGRDKNDYKGGFSYSCWPYIKGYTGNHPIGGDTFWERTTVFKIYNGTYTRLGNPAGSNLDKYIFANYNNAKYFCKNLWYDNGKVLKIKKGNPVKYINYNGEKDYMGAYKTVSVSNNKSVDLIEYVKCWNGTPSSDPDLSKVDFSKSEKLVSKIENGTKVTSLTSSYYWRNIGIIPFPNTNLGKLGVCNNSNLGTQKNIGGATYRCQIHDESTIPGSYSYVNDLVTSNIWKIKKIVNGWKYVSIGGKEFRLKDYNIINSGEREFIKYNGKNYVILRKMELLGSSQGTIYFKNLYGDGNQSIYQKYGGSFYKRIGSNRVKQ